MKAPASTTPQSHHAFFFVTGIQITQFIRISTHVIYTQFIWELSFNCMRTGLAFNNWIQKLRNCSAIVIIPCHFINIIAARIFETSTFIAASSSIFPLVICREIKFPSNRFIQSMNKCPSIWVRPGQIHWQIPSFIPTRIEYTLVLIPIRYIVIFSFRNCSNKRNMIYNKAYRIAGNFVFSSMNLTRKC